MNKLDVYTSTGLKILRHGEELTKWNKGIPRPQSLQVAPTEKCSLSCSFCSVAKRSKRLELPFDELCDATQQFIDLGIKTVEITGGGDPLMYPQINEYLAFLFAAKLQVGMITNSLGINKVLDKELLNQLTWIRISSNVLDYKDRIHIPEGYPGTLGFSYCWTEGFSTKEQLQRIQAIALANNVKYIRVVPDCLGDREKINRQDTLLIPLIRELGEPFFYQQKDFGTPNQCYLAYWKPFLYCDGYVFPCSSTVLNQDADRTFNEKYRWCHWKDVKKIYGESVVSAIDASLCDHCVFCAQNATLEFALNKQSMEDFF